MEGREEREKGRGGKQEEGERRGKGRKGEKRGKGKGGKGKGMERTPTAFWTNQTLVTVQASDRHTDK